MNAKVKGYMLGAIAAATYGMNPLLLFPCIRQEWILTQCFFQIPVCPPRVGNNAESKRSEF